MTKFAARKIARIHNNMVNRNFGESEIEQFIRRRRRYIIFAKPGAALLSGTNLHSYGLAALFVSPSGICTIGKIIGREIENFEFGSTSI